MRHYASGIGDAIFIVVNLFIRKIKSGFYTVNGHGFPNRHLIWFLLLISGLILGSFLVSDVSEVIIADSFLFDFLSALTAMFLGSSFLGCLLIPIVLVFRGAVLYFSFAYSGAAFSISIVSTVIPLFLGLVSFFLTCDASFILSSRIGDALRGIYKADNRGNVIWPLIGAGILLIIDFFFRLYTSPVS